MEIKLYFEELTAYVQKHYGHALIFSRAGENTLCVAYSKKVLIKTVQVPVNLTIEEVTPTTVTISYDGKVLGLDMIIGGALKAVKSLMPEMTEALSAGEGHRITIDLSRLKKTAALLKAVAIRSINIHDDSIVISTSFL